MIDTCPMNEIRYKVLQEVHDKLVGKFDPPGRNITMKDMLRNMDLIYQAKAEIEKKRNGSYSSDNSQREQSTRD